MTRIARTTFAALALATFGAFFVTQRLKQAPRVVRTLTVTDLFSPNGDHRHDDATIRFALDSQSDDVTVTIIDSAGDVVRHLADERHVEVRTKQRLIWDGRDDHGHVVPDGGYRVRIQLRHEARSAVLLTVIHVDTTAPRPVVQMEGWQRRNGPLILSPGAGPITFRYVGPTSHLPPRYLVYRSDVTPPKIVVRGIRGARGSHIGRWDGRIHGRPAPPGTYFVAVRIRDRASNTGTSPPLHRRLPGQATSRPGITIRALAAQPPLEPVRGGARARFFVDARGRPYEWRIRRVGAGRALHAFRRVRGPVLSVRAPHGTGVYLLELRSDHRRNRASVPFSVQDPARHRILLVLPALSWQGRNMVDDDGNGLPNTLVELGYPNSADGNDSRVRLFRVFAGDGLPNGFRRYETPLLAFLDRMHLRYDVTTDLALARGDGPRLRGHSGVVLAGRPTWLPPGLRSMLRAYVRRGGRAFVVGADVLRRGVLLQGAVERDPSRERPTDIFGVRLGPVVHRSVNLLVPTDSIGLFRGTDGAFGGFDAYEAIRSAGLEATQVAAATLPDGRAVIAALRYGRGLIVRTGLPQWSERLAGDPDVAAMTERTWTLLGR